MERETNMMKWALMGTALAALTGCVAVEANEVAAKTTVSHFGSQAMGGTQLPFSKSVTAGDTIYISGELGTDPATGNLVTGGTGSETTQIFINMERTLASQGADLSNIVKCTVYLNNIENFGEMNTAYKAALPDPKPARATVAVTALAMGANLEIDCIAVKS